MASFASSATTCGARKHAWTKKKNYEMFVSAHILVFVSHTEKCKSPTQKGVCLLHKCGDTNTNLSEEKKRQKIIFLYSF